MTTTVDFSHNSFAVTLQDLIEYPATGLTSKLLLKDKNSQYKLLCLTAGTNINDHTSPRNVVITVIEGNGTLNLKGKEIALAPGVFAFIPANAPHAIQAQENLSFVLTLSEQPSSVQATSHTWEAIREKYHIQNPGHVIYLGLGDRDW